MTMTSPLRRTAAVAAAVGALLAAAVLLLPAVLDADARSQPRSPGSLPSAIPRDVAGGLEHLGLRFEAGAVPPDLGVSRAVAVSRASAEFGGIAKGVPAAVAAFGSFTNTTYGPARADGTPEPTIVDRPAWIIVYRDVPQTQADQLGGDPWQEPEAFTASTDLVVFVDATTGRPLGATTLPEPEPEPEPEPTATAGVTK